MRSNLNLREISEASSRDPRKALLDAAGPATDYEPFHNNILVVTYISPPILMQGPDGKPVEIHRTDRSMMEDRFQNKVGLVLKVGPLAFKDDAGTKFGGLTVEPGDWVLYRPSDAMEVFLKDWTGKKNDGLSCKLVEDVFIKMRISDPSLVY